MYEKLKMRFVLFMCFLFMTVGSVMAGKGTVAQINVSFWQQMLVTSMAIDVAIDNSKCDLYTDGYQTSQYSEYDLYNQNLEFTQHHMKNLVKNKFMGGVPTNYDRLEDQVKGPVIKAIEEFCAKKDKRLWALTKVVKELGFGADMSDDTVEDMGRILLLNRISYYLMGEVEKHKGHGQTEGLLDDYND